MYGDSGLGNGFRFKGVFKVALLNSLSDVFGFISPIFHFDKENMSESTSKQVFCMRNNEEWECQCLETKYC